MATTEVGRNAVASASSALTPPFQIPLHISNTSQHSFGPTLPKDWRTRWNVDLTNDFTLALPEDPSSVPLELIEPDCGRTRWITCMTAWDVDVVDASKRTETERVQSSKLPPQIAIADERGGNVALEEDQSVERPTRRRIRLGNQQSGRRIAIATQDGNVWIFEEPAESQLNDAPPMSPSTSFDSRLHLKSRNSFGSPTLLSNVSRQQVERDSVTSPTSASVGMSQINASATSIRMREGMEAEEKLEMQWHAGEAKSTMMSGMMEALGLQHSHSHEHEHHHHEHHRKHSGPPSPSKLFSRGIADQKSHTVPGTPERRLRGASTPAEKSDEKSDTGSKLGESAFVGGNGHAVVRPRAGSIALANEGGLLRGTTSPQIEEASDTSPQSSMRSLNSVKPFLLLQCSSCAPITSLTVRSTRDGDDALLTLQTDGRLTSWSLGETLTVHKINLKTAKVSLIESDTNQAEPPSLQSISSPLARLVSLPSPAGTPSAPRSRAASNASQPPETTDLPGVSKFDLIQLYLPSSRSALSANLIIAYDTTRRRLHVVDCSRFSLVAQDKLSEAGATPPCAQMLPDGELIEVMYLNKAGAIIVETFRIKAKAKVAPPDFGGPLSSTSAFLRREGLSQPGSRPESRPVSRATSRPVSRAAVSRPPSVFEDLASKKKDLGTEGVAKNAKGILLLSERRVLTWSDGQVSLAKRVADWTIRLDSLSLSRICHVTVKDDQVTVRTKERIVVYSVRSDKFDSTYEEELSSLCDAHSTDASSCSLPLVCSRTEDDRINLRYGKQNLWRSKVQNEHDDAQILASLPFSMERIVLSLSSGHLVMCSLTDLLAGQLPPANARKQPHTGTITFLQHVIHPKSKVKLVFGGSDEGDVVIWSASTLEMQTELTVLNAPVVRFVAFGDQDNVLRLHGCVACISADGAIAVVDLDLMDLLYLIPGRDARLDLLAVRSDELLVTYGDGRARVWDMSTGEISKSIGADQAAALIDDGKGWWSTFPIDVEYFKREKGASGVLSSIPYSRSQLAGTMTADVRRVVEATSRMVAPLSTSASDTSHVEGVPVENAKAHTVLVASSLNMPQARKALHTLRPVLKCFLPRLHGNREYDDLVRIVFDGQIQYDASTPVVELGTFNEPGYLAIGTRSRIADEQSFCVSSAFTTIRLIASIAILMVLTNIAELHDAAQELIVILGSLHGLIGEHYQQPTMSMLMAYMADPVLEIKQAAQTLFVSSLASMPQAELDAICSEYGSSLPVRRRRQREAESALAGQEDMKSGEEEEEEKDAEEAEEEELRSSKALMLLGLITTQRYTDLAPGLLKDVSASIDMYLNDEEHPTRRSIAITLCDRGFSIFQHYFDAMEIVRTLFTLSTMSREREASTTVELENRDLARQAVLRIAEENTPLFMTTLSLDILHARSPEHCSATMRLVAFMVRRKPLLLYPNLPRLAEAVVKSLDPTITALRAVVHRSATIIISELIAAYPTIAFHKDLQRLAVGTFEGAIIMYDLKTATRLYVLEAHSTSLNGLIFSNDGRRLISICLGDGMLKVWKTGVGIGSLFSFGSAPRQMSALLGLGSGGSGGAHSSEATANVGQEASPSSQSTTGTPPYKSFDFGRLAGNALASVKMRSPTSPGSGFSTSSTTNFEDGKRWQSELTLVRFDWTAERSIRIRIGEASLVFDVA